MAYKTLKKSKSLITGRSAAARKVQDVLRILPKAGVPVGDLTPRRQEKMALALLSIANMKPESAWSSAAIYGNESTWKLTSREIIAFENTHWNQHISMGSYDDIRRKDLERLLLAGIALASVSNPNANKNNPTRRYAIGEPARELLHAIGTTKENDAAATFVANNASLEEQMERRRPVHLEARLPDGNLIKLADGEHNRLQKAVLENFVPHFVRNPRILYIADSGNRSLHVDIEGIKEVRLPTPSDDMLPDIVVLDQARSWVLLIEAVHSSNPISRERHLSLERYTNSCRLPKVFVSVFANRKEFKEWASEISWETEVWLADSPSHMIHFNGDKFLGPYVKSDE